MTDVQQQQRADQAIAVIEPRASRLAQVTGFTDQVIALVQQTVAPGATRLELAMYLYNARRLGLDPMLRQIYFIKYKRDAPGEIVIGIDGYRSRAEASGAYAGSDEAQYEYDDVGQPDGAPSKATVTVYKMLQGQRVPFTAAVRWAEFYPGAGPVGDQWRKRPHNQMSVRAESHALRKAFPSQMGDLEPHEAPFEWEHAARLDDAARQDPALVAANARRYDEIFAAEDDPLPSTATRSAAVTTNGNGQQVDTGTGEVLEPPKSESAPPTKEDLWAENRRLVARAAELGILDVPTLNTKSSIGALQLANDDVAERVHNAELDLQLAAQTEQGRLA